MFQTTLRTLALTTTLLVAPAWANEGFTKRDFKGDYAFHLDGVLTSLGAPIVTAYDAAVGRFTADGAGKITQGTRSVNANGKNFTETFTCTYNIIPMERERPIVTSVFSASRPWTLSC
jgi:hypothetical protein